MEHVMEPCKFAVIEIGSLARNEITPYSDIKYIIVMKNQEIYEKHLKYF